MKKFFLLLLCLVFFLSGCGKNEIQQPSETQQPSEAQQTTAGCEQQSKQTSIYTWLSCFELQVTQDRKNEKEYEQYITLLVDNMAEIGVTDVFVHVRPYADALYYSEIFPQSFYASGRQGERADFDILQKVISCAEKRQLRVHAWINPYRVSSFSSVDGLSEDNVALCWLREKTGDAAVTENGIWFNPSSLSVQKLIIDGVRELLENYSLAGIHFDDYFYPDDSEFDKDAYELYLSSGGELSLNEWRKESVNSLMASVYSLVKSFGEDKIFSVSPSGDIEKCETESCADVSLWCSEKGYCDVILPQIYYGFEHSRLPFGDCLERWAELCTEPEVTLAVGLALYKSGLADEFAGAGKDEWKENSDIISRQVELLYEQGYGDFALYSASYINFSETFLSEELKNLKNVIQ